MVAAGKIKCSRDRDRPREVIMGGLGRWHAGISVTELTKSTRDRDMWRAMNALTISEGT